MKERHLSEASVREHAGEILKRAEREWKLRHMGCLTDEEWYLRTEKALIYAGVMEFLAENGLQPDLRGGRFIAFKRDQEAFHKGMGPVEWGASPWLTVSPGEAAGPEDHCLTLQLMELLHLGADCFRPFETEAPCPRNRESHAWHRCRACDLDFGCRDDGGLLSDPDPVGKTFILAGDYGLKAALTIREDKSGGDRSDYDPEALAGDAANAAFCRNGILSAVGSIEGYTQDLRTEGPEVLIRISRGKVTGLSYYESPGDREAHRAFPLWQQYYKEMQTFCREREKILRDSFLELGRTFGKQPLR